MDLSPDYVALARELPAALAKLDKAHVWADGDYFYCPHEGVFGIVSAHHQESNEDHVWLPRLEQLLDVASLFGVDWFELERKGANPDGLPAAWEWVRLYTGTRYAEPTAERGLLRIILAAG